MRILFSGYYGQNNTGDDSFVEVSSWGAKNFWNIENPIYISSQLPKTINNCNSLGKEYYKGYFRLKAYKEIIKSKGFVIAGGSVLHSEILNFDFYKIAQIRKQIAKKSILGAIGVSLGPFKSLKAEKQIKEFLMSFSFLAVRDSLSFEIASSFNLPYIPIRAFDLAALLPSIYSDKDNLYSKIKPLILGVSLCYYESYVGGNVNNESRRNKNIEDILSIISKNYHEITIRFFVFNGHPKIGDKEITDAFVEKIKTGKCKIEIVEYDANIYNMWKKISECSYVLSTRLHAAIFACFSEVPFTLIEYHRKCVDFLNEIDYREDMRVHDAEIDPSIVAERIVNRIYNEKFKPLSINVNVLTEKAIRNFSLTAQAFK